MKYLRSLLAPLIMVIMVLALITIVLPAQPSGAQTEPPVSTGGGGALPTATVVQGPLPLPAEGATATAATESAAATATPASDVPFPQTGQPDTSILWTYLATIVLSLSLVAAGLWLRRRRGARPE